MNAEAINIEVVKQTDEKIEISDEVRLITRMIRHLDGHINILRDNIAHYSLKIQESDIHEFDDNKNKLSRLKKLRNKYTNELDIMEKTRHLFDGFISENKDINKMFVSFYVK